MNANDPADRFAHLALLNEDLSTSFSASDGDPEGANVGARTNAFTQADATTEVAADGENRHLFRTGGTDASPTYAAESASNNDPNNDIVRQVVVADGAKSWDTWGTSVQYSDGPMAMSLSHLATEWDDGGEQDATMLSMSYTLAPGVASKTSVVTAERTMASGRSIDGTAFVTGITLSF